MIRTIERPLVPRDKPDDRGLGPALERAGEDGPAETELKRQAQSRERDLAAGEEVRTVHATRTLFADALYRGKRLNGDGSFDLADMSDLDALMAVAERLGERRRARTQGHSGDAP